MGKIDLTDQRFGRLVVLYENGRAKNRKVLWRCKCDCGNEVTVIGSDLRSGNTTSCGCYSRELTLERITTHGMRRTRLYRVWHGMLERTGIHKGADEKFKRGYIDRGITVCEEWFNFENFRDWSLSHGYADDLQIDREDNDKGYSPENCRWVSAKENCNNRRNTLRLDDGTSLAMFCARVGIQTCENGQDTKQYHRIRCMWSSSRKPHPELLAKANEYLNTLRKLKASIDLLADIKKFKENLRTTTVYNA